MDVESLTNYGLDERPELPSGFPVLKQKKYRASRGRHDSLDRGLCTPVDRRLPERTEISVWSVRVGWYVCGYVCVGVYVRTYILVYMYVVLYVRVC